MRRTGQVEKSGITRSGQAAIGWQLVCPETEEAIEVAADCQEKKPQIATRCQRWKIAGKSGSFQGEGGCLAGGAKTYCSRCTERKCFIQIKFILILKLVQRITTNRMIIYHNSLFFIAIYYSFFFNIFKSLI